MIIPNGTISMQIKQKGGGIDPTTGYPISPVCVWSDPIECQYMQQAYNALARVENEHQTERKYVVLLNGNVTSLLGHRIRLQDESGGIVGDFSIISTEYFRAVDQTKILI